MAKGFLRSIRAGKRKAGIADLASICRKEVEAVMDEVVKPALVEEHRKIVKDWESDVDFAAKKVLKPSSIAVYVYPTGKDKLIWIYVDKGTKPHKITAKNAPRLAFMAGVYVPKTLPGVVVQGGGYVKDPTLVTPKSVDHPGSDPRRFTEAIAEDFLPFFRRQTEYAFRRAARKVNEQK